MSQNSARQNYEAFKEWYQWAKGKYPSLKVKKKLPAPDWMTSKYEG